MDIFEIAQQGMKIQAQEQKELQLEQEAEAKGKSFKLDIHEILRALAEKDYDWFNRLGENQKAFSPYMTNLWLSMLWNKDSYQKAFSNNDKVYVEMIKSINERLNTGIFSMSKEMYWLLANTIQFTDAPFTTDYKKLVKKETTDKIPKKVIDYISQELYSSSDKIYDMIHNGLITEDALKAIALDLDTLEEQKRKK